ncbi:phosphoenolpyruvate synthase [Bacillus massilinigeriensis]|uniref:phosphoenolpyruvate synthase n=1 Tax=Bacillus massilionigeriensis TaxID=1805475 RepID=UPI00096B03EE|nr:phosphoenolpyruvate synthase [Bacillus massilionigeriensis]
MSRLTLGFAEIRLEDIPVVGGKNASLGEMYRELTPKGIKIPDGFATTADAYFYFLQSSGLESSINEILNKLDPYDTKDLAEKGKQIRELILSAKFPIKLTEEIKASYNQLCAKYGAKIDVAVRSSATAEDLPEASFAGAQETFLNIRGVDALIESCRKCYASLFNDRAIFYREVNGFKHSQVALSIGVQKMVRSDLASSGVIFTLDTETGFQDVVFLTSAYGLGENVVKGSVNPDEFYVFKPTLKIGFKPIIAKTIGSKEIKMVYEEDENASIGLSTKNIPVPLSERKLFSINDNEILQLSQWAVLIEEHYSNKAGYKKPMDIEWGKDGLSGELYILQARPETVQAKNTGTRMTQYSLLEEGKVLAVGRAVGAKVGYGKVRIIKSVKDIELFQEGEILVTSMTDPDWVPIMKKAAGIITERGGRTCHAAIVSRELGIPAIVGADNAMNLLKDGMEVTLSCTGKDEGKIYEGILKFHKEMIELKQTVRPKTNIMMNVGNPEEAFKLSAIPNDGVGLARMEFIINSHIQIHPLALIHYPEIKESDKKLIDELTVGYENKVDYFIEKLAQGIGKIAASFYPKDVIVRMSDFKTNEYANLLGGSDFEPKEDNPMLGFRGASRYYNPRYRQGFALECAAIKKVREEMGLFNVKVMIPFCRTIEEGKKVLEELEKNQLVQGEHGLEVYLMCELPSNVILADEFLKYFDGFSIGSNDLTQLVLGLDRDSEIVAPLFDERNEAVKEMLKKAIKVAKANNKKVGICGQAPSDYPEIAQLLVECGIDSMSLNPDAVISTSLKVYEWEKDHDLKLLH